MTTRTHLSIGEVLSLLSDDFPDLTITKIRFLESQGLIDPERTASGYRKFYDFDIERLRWILRQQRENFLPLKVIRERLDRSDGKLGDVTSDEPVSPEPGQAQLDLARDPGSADPPPVWMADHSRATQGSGPAATVDGEPKDGEPSQGKAGAEESNGTSKHDGATGLKHADSATAPTPRSPDTATSTHATSKPTPPNPAPPKSTPKAPPKSPPKAAEAYTVKPPAKAKTSVDKAATSTASTLPESLPAGGSTAPRGPLDDAPTKPVKSPPAVSKQESAMASLESPAATDVSDVSMTRAELLAATGLDERQLTQLESFNIVIGSNGPDGPIYGAVALVCARHAATFLALGMEARHLRAFKVAADREAGLYEQAILPLLRKRNPAARAEATQLVGRLASTGAGLHAALLQQSLRSQLRDNRGN